MARSVSVKSRTTMPVTNSTMSDRIAWRYEFVAPTTAPKINGPIHDVPRSEISYSPKNDVSRPFGIIRENNERDSAWEPPSTSASTAPMNQACVVLERNAYAYTTIPVQTSRESRIAFLV